MFSIREVEYILTIFKTGGISKAAKICNVSQPALSKQVNKLESVLGFKIFERERSKNIPTAKGRELIVYFEEIFTRYTKIKQINSNHDNLKIGIIPTIAPYFLPKIVEKLSALEKTIYFFEQKTATALGSLKAGELDLVILAFYPKMIPADFCYKKLYMEEFFFVTNKSNNISISDGIQSNKIILLEDGNCVNKSIESICNITNKSQNNFSATSIEVVKAMIATNNGYGILPKMTLDNDKNNFNIEAFKPEKYREIGVCYRKNFSDTKLVQNFIKILKI